MPIVATFPTTDRASAAFVRDCLDELALDEREDPAALQRLIRRWHTRAIVRPQDRLAAFAPRHQKWYVFRDGRAGEAGWWREDGVARVVFDGAGTFLEASPEADALARRAPGALIGTPWSALVPPAAQDLSAGWVWEALATAGAVDSVFDLPLEGGAFCVIQYHTEQAERPGEFVSYWRQLEIASRRESRPGSG